MPSKEFLDKIRKELAPLKKFWVVLYGSHARGDADPRSDIDIAVITRCKDPRKNAKIYYEILGMIPPKYDVKIFEEMPLYLKARVFLEGIVIFGYPPDVTEYMYQFWKIWKDMEKRVRENSFKSIKERIETIKRVRKILAKRKKHDFDDC